MPTPLISDDLAHVRAHWPLLCVGTESRYFSSFDRTGGNDDGFNGTFSALYVDTHGEHVIFDAEGPGCLRTLWFTSSLGGYDALDLGLLRFYFDGEETPRIEVEANELFSGFTAPFVRPLVADNRISTGGFVSWVPLPYRESLRITTEKRAAFYIAQYDTFPADDAVPTWTPATGAIGVEVFARPVPTGGDATHKGNPIEYEGSGTLEFVRFEPAATPDKAALQTARIRIWWDGASAAAVDCPLGHFFGSGLYQADVRSFAFAMRQGLYENRFPMPFGAGFRIETTGLGGTLSVRVGPFEGNPVEIGRLHAAFRREHPTEIGRDFLMLETEGAGKLVGTVLVVEPPTPETKSWWEGDLRSYTNGKRTPSLHGTGHEDDHLGGWSNEFLDTPFTLPMHGEPAVEMLDRNGQFNGNCSLYRLWPGITFLDGLRHSVEHGNENGVNYNYSGTAFWYAFHGVALKETDRLDICEGASRDAHAVTVQNESDVAELTSSFEGCAYRDLVTMTHRSNLNRLSFTAALASSNRGVYLRRVYDQFHGRQRARVSVDGKFVGIWYTAEENRTCRWAEREFFIPEAFVRGKSSVRIEIDPPASTPLWDAAEYRVLCVVGV
jgi:hypothetical protein